MTLTEFEYNLREKLKNYERPRPLICDGNPLDSEIFIVGINAATEMNKGFGIFGWKKAVLIKLNGLKVTFLNENSNH